MTTDRQSLPSAEPRSSKPRFRLHIDGSVERVLPVHRTVAYFRDGERIPVSASRPSDLAGGSDDPRREGAEASAPPSLGVSSLNLPAAGGSHPAQTPPPAFSGMPDLPFFLDRRAEAADWLARVRSMPDSMSEGAQG